MSESDLYALLYISFTLIAGMIYFWMVSRVKKIISDITKNDTGEVQLSLKKIILGETQSSLEAIKKINDCNSTLIASLGILVFWASPAPLVIIFSMFSDNSSQGWIQNILNSFIDIFLQGNYIVTYMMAITALGVLWIRIDPDLIVQAEKLRRLGKKILGELPDSSK